MKTLKNNPTRVTRTEQAIRLACRSLLSIVLLGSVAVNRAQALSYVLTPEGRQQYEAEYRTLTTQRQQVQNNIRDLCGVLSSSNQMFVYSLHGSNRWEYWSTNQVAARLRQLSPTDAGYRAYWQMILQQHLTYGNQVRNQLLPQLQQQLAGIDSRLQSVSYILANSVVQGEDSGGLTNVSVNTSPVHIKLWDHGSQDGDVVQLFVNGIFQRQISLTTDGTTISLPLAYGRHRLEVLAMNEGDDGPNTASIKITGVVKGEPEQQWRLNTGKRASMWINVGQ